MPDYDFVRPVRTADATPHASSLIQSLRDIGYSLETALADIVDNSITAKADQIDIVSETSIDDPCIAIIDNGVGMHEQELIDAMRPGSQNPLDERDELDLGRFGLGMKSASFSQCRRLTVISRRDGKISGATWDLDDVAISNEWRITVHDNISQIPWSDHLPESGTIVVWEKLDRMSGEIAKDSSRRADYLNKAIVDAERHIRLVFHRFMEKSRKPLQIRLNGRQLSPIDPFASKHTACQADPAEQLKLSKGTITIQSFTIPHQKMIKKAEWDDIGGPEGHLKSQGFYIYRSGRLIICGGWLGLAKQTELTKLCRVRIDIPNTMDAMWKIDVKKASAQLPPIVRERLKRVIERFSSMSKRTFQKRGQRLVDENRMPMWNRALKDGVIIYRPNSDHPMITEYMERLPEDLKNGFRNCISLIGSSLPIESLFADMTGRSEEMGVDEATHEAIIQSLEAMIPKLLERGLADDSIMTLLRNIDPYKDAWDTSELMIQELLGKSENNE